MKLIEKSTLRFSQSVRNVMNTGHSVHDACISGCACGRIRPFIRRAGCWKEEGLKTLDGRARSAGVSRNWSVLYVSYLEVTLAEGVYKLYVVYRRQEERDSRYGSGVEGPTAATSDVGSCCCYRQFIRTIARPINESAPQALSTVVRLSARSGSHPFPSVSQQRCARSQPTQRLTNRWRLSATRAEFRKVVLSSSLSLSLSFAML